MAQSVVADTTVLSNFAVVERPTCFYSHSLR